MSAQHTPGPWSFSRTCDILAPIGDTGKQGIIAKVRVIYAPSGEAERRANARLIAAAPELLEALRPLAALLVPAKPQGNAGAYSIRHSDIRAAAAAIAKATGDA